MTKNQMTNNQKNVMLNPPALKVRRAGLFQYLTKNKIPNKVRDDRLVGVLGAGQAPPRCGVGLSFYLLTFVFLLSMAATPAIAAGDLDPDVWARKCPIVIQSSQVSGTADLTNFPILLTEDTLPSEMFSGANAAKNGGGDIRFSSDSSGTTELCFEIVTFDTTADTAEIWVKIPTLDYDDNTTIYVWYKNAAASGYAEGNTYGKHNTWNSNYTMVQHMKDTTTSTTTDSTSNNHDGTKIAANQPIVTTSGKIDDAQNFDASNDYMTTAGDIDTLGSFTYSAIIKKSSNSGTDMFLDKEIGGSLWPSVRFFTSGTAAGFDFYKSSSTRQLVNSTGLTLDTSSFYHLVGTYNGSFLKIYVNGSFNNQAAASGTPNNINNTLSIGRSQNNVSPFYGSLFHGIIDEVRILTTALSDDWIATEYANQNSPNTFAVEGSPSTPISFPDNWERKCAITIQSSQVSGTANLTNFPFLLTEETLPSEMFDADGTYPAKNGGGDIRFSFDSAGTTQLCFEVVDFTTDNDPANGTAEIWVKIPTLDYNDDTTIYVWYNNTDAVGYSVGNTYGAENVWDSDYLMVHHLNENGNNTANGYVDSTSNDNDGTGVSMTTSSDVTGQIGLGQYFDGSADCIRSASANMVFTNAISMSAWFKTPGGGGTNPRIVEISNDGSSYSHCLAYDLDGTIRAWLDAAGGDTRFSGDLNNDPTTYNDNNWYHMLITHDGDNTRLYIDDTQVDTDGTNCANLDDGPYFVIGDYYTGSNGFRGTIDEVRVSDIVRSTDWVTTEYNNQTAPNACAIEGSPQDASGAKGPASLSVSLKPGTHFKSGVIVHFHKTVRE